jgi:hypothetical protein
MAKEYYQLIRSFGGLSLEYSSVSESFFAGASGAAYTPPERGDLRRIAGARQVQLLSDAPGVIETFQTSATGDLFLPANTFADNTNDAGNGRIFFIKNSGTTALTVKDYLGTSLKIIYPGLTTLFFGNNLNNWDYLEQSLTTLKDNLNPVNGVTTLNFGTNLTVTDDGSGKVTVNSTTPIGTGLKEKSGTVSPGSFSGNPKKATVTFVTAFPSNAYAISITGENGRTYTWESKVAGSFVINTNANAALTGNVDWIAIDIGESI